MAATNLPTIAHPVQRTIRTAVQVLAGFASVVLTYQAVLQPLLGTPNRDSALGWAATVAGQVVLIATVIAYVMTIPAVDTFLTAIGIGSVPRSEIALVHVPTQEEALRAAQQLLHAPDGASAGTQS